MAKTSDKVAVEIVPKQRAECSVSELRLHSTSVHHFFHEASHGVTLDDVMRPGYWRTIWRQLGRAKWTEVTVVAVDGTWEAHLRVLAVGEGFARMRLLNEWHTDERVNDSEIPSDWVVDWVTSGWRVRAGDGAVISDKQPTRADAINEASAHVRRIIG